MVVGDDNVSPGPHGISDFVGVADSAINRYDKGGSLGNQPLHSGRRHPVPFIHRMRQIRDDVRAEPVQGLGEYGGSGNAVNVKVAEHRHRLAGTNSSGQPGQRRVDAGQQVGRVRQPGRVEKLLQGAAGSDAAGQEQLNGGSGQVGGQPVAVRRRGREPPFWRRTRRLRRHKPARARTITELWPPNPKELLSTTFRSAGRAALGT